MKNINGINFFLDEDGVWKTGDNKYHIYKRDDEMLMPYVRVHDGYIWLEEYCETLEKAVEFIKSREEWWSNNTINVFLDDCRKEPDGFILAKSFETCVYNEIAKLKPMTSVTGMKFC